MTLRAQDERAGQPETSNGPVRAWLFPLIGVVAFLVTATTNPGAGDAGLITVASHAGDLLAVVWITWLLTSIGALVVRRINGFASPIVRISAAVLVGIALVSTVLLGAGLMGVLRPAAWLLFPVSAVVVVAKRFDHVALCWVRSALKNVRAMLSGFPLVAGAAVLLLVFIVLMATQPVDDWDSLMYHLLVPSEWLERGRIFLPDDNHHVAYVGIVQMLYMPMEAFGIRAGPSMFQVAPALMTVLVVADLCQRVAGKAAGLLGFSLMAGSSALLVMSYVPRVDGWAILAVAVVAWVVLPLADEKLDNVRSRTILAGVVAGCGFGVKYQPVAFLIPLVVLLLFLSIRRRTATGLLVGSCAGLAIATPWLLKNWALLGAPVYPFFSEPLAWGWLDQIEPGYQPVRTYKPLAASREPFSWWAWLARPHTLFLQRDGIFSGLHPAMVLAPLALLTRRRRLTLVAVTVAVAGVLMIVGVSPETNLRYLQPAFVGLGLAATLALVALVDLLPEKRRSSYLGVIALVLLVPSAIWVATHLPYGGFEYALGVTTASEWLSENETLVYLDGLDSGLKRAGASRTMLLFEPRVATFESDVIQDMVHTNWPEFWEATEGQCPDPGAFSHVAVNEGFRQLLIRRGMDPLANRWPEFEAFAARCLVPVEAVGPYDLYRLDPR